MKRLIINADDFGWDADANNGILHLLETRKLLSTTIMSNMVQDDPLQTLALLKGISTGIHINLVTGQALSDEAIKGGLADKNGRFHGSLKLWLKFLTGKISRASLEAEITAQIERLRASGISVSHADSHQHTHQFPFLGKYIIKALNKNGIQKIRNARPIGRKNLRMIILYTFCLFTTHHLRGKKTTKGLISFFSTNNGFSTIRFEKELIKAFRKKNTLECMTHPGLKNKAESHLKRRQEFDFWAQKSWQDLIKKHNIHLINYQQL